MRIRKTSAVKGLALGFVSLGLMVIFSQNVPENSSEWASWVQAVGSIVAIFAAYIVGERQAAMTLATSRQAIESADRAKRSATAAIVKAAFSYAASLGNLCEKDDYSPMDVLMLYDERVYSGFVEALHAVPVHEIGRVAAVTNFMGFKNSLIKLQPAIERFLPFHGSKPDPIEIPKLLQLMGQHEALQMYYRGFCDAIEPSRS